MCSDTNLSKQFEEIMEEAKGICLAEATRSAALNQSEANLVANIKLVRLLNQTCDLCVDMFKKQNELMNKLDKAVDKYLNQ